MEGEGSKSVKAIRAKAVSATLENFKTFGQVIGPSPDGAKFGPQDAHLKLDAGIPRFYIIELKGGFLHFNNITHHANVTQCLGSVGGHTWYIGVARPSIVEGNDSGINKLEGSLKAVRDENCISNSDESVLQYSHGKNIIRSKTGHYYVPPAPDDVHIFRVEGHQFVKLNVGTWHAGPLFRESSMNFYNLELSNTNVSGIPFKSLPWFVVGFLDVHPKKKVKKGELHMRHNTPKIQKFNHITHTYTKEKNLANTHTQREKLHQCTHKRKQSNKHRDGKNIEFSNTMPLFLLGAIMNLSSLFSVVLLAPWISFLVETHKTVKLPSVMLIQILIHLECRTNRRENSLVILTFLLFFILYNYFPFYLLQ